MTKTKENKDIEQFVFEEWKVNNELFKWHEDLKQKRFSYFLSFQTAFLAAFVLLMRDFLTSFVNLSKLDLKYLCSVLLLLSVISSASYLVSKSYQAMDYRARAYVDTIKSKLLLLEANWKSRFPENPFTTYSEQFSVLVHKNDKLINQYISSRKIHNDPFRSRLTAKAAHVTEEILFKFISGFWLVVFTASLLGAASVFLRLLLPTT